VRTSDYNTLWTLPERFGTFLAGVTTSKTITVLKGGNGVFEALTTSASIYGCTYPGQRGRASYAELPGTITYDACGRHGDR